MLEPLSSFAPPPRGLLAVAQLSPNARQAAAPLVERWQSFTGKVGQRLVAVLAEADAGIAELIAVNPTDAQAIGTGFSAVESRLKGLEEKVQEAVDKLEQDWDEATDDLEVSDADQALLRRSWRWIVEDGRRFQRDIEQRREMWTIDKGAEWARVLHHHAETELSQRHTCAQCGAPLAVTVRHAASNVSCQSCSAVNQIEIGLASGLYFGGGIHHLARAAARDHWLSEWQHQHWLNDLRHPSEADRQRYLAAARQHWLAYYQAYAQLHPGFDQDVAAAAEGKMGHYTHWDQAAELRIRQRVGQAVERATARDRAGLLACLRAGDDPDPEELACAVYERGDRDGAALVLDLAYELAGEDEDRPSWIAEKLQEIDDTLYG